ncbi:Tyrosinase [Bagarius yarrelli]|uniref:Tyrosinase n=1 Tax=Bagarius yarrelli TaxID=175774 RepID=A0A556TTZ0_BAGYA|nr:Tyrosinase [Bagarius yarrelli]
MQPMTVVHILLLQLMCVSHAQFPRPCTTTEALQSKTCCPTWPGDGSACGANSGRGFCKDVSVSDLPNGPQFPHSNVDDRERWPLVFYNRTCQCAGNFMGYHCGRVQLQLHNFTIPYWDWRDARDCQVCTDELMGARSPLDPNLISPASVFSSWKVICTHPEEYNAREVLCDGRPEGPLLRNPGNHDSSRVNRLPSNADVEFVLSLTQYESDTLDKRANMSFRNALEGFASPETGIAVTGQSTMHNALHIFMNGSIDLPTVPPTSDYPPKPHNGWPLQHGMVPFIPLYRNMDYFVSTKELGYDYTYLLDPTQRLLQEFITPYWEHVQQIWPWLLGAAVLGALVAASFAVIIRRVIKGTRRQRHRKDEYEEKQPLLHGEEDTASYQTTL